MSKHIENNKQTFERVKDFLERLREAGALSGRLNDRLIIKPDSGFDALDKELEAVLVKASFTYETAQWGGAKHLFVDVTTFEGWRFLECSLLAKRFDFDQASPIPEAPFENEMRAVLLAIKPPKTDAVKALIKLCESDAWFQMAIQDWRSNGGQL